VLWTRCLPCVLSRVPLIPDNFAPADAVRDVFGPASFASVRVDHDGGLARACRPEGGKSAAFSLRRRMPDECPTRAQRQSALENAAHVLDVRLIERRRMTVSDVTRSCLDILETLLKTLDITETAERVRISGRVPPDILK